jgi:hypothetical protein
MDTVSCILIGFAVYWTVAVTVALVMVCHNHKHVENIEDRIDSKSVELGIGA